MIDLLAVEALLGQPVSDDVPETIRVPGQHRRHYAPTRGSMVSIWIGLASGKPCKFGPM